MMHRKQVLALSALTLLLMFICVIVFSWIVSSVNPSLPIRSMISEEGVRQFMGGFAYCLASPLLVWLVLCSIAWGTFRYSGFCDAILCVYRGRPITYREKHALIISAIFFIVFCIVIISLTFVPHAVLLEVTGELCPSAFTAGAVPLFAFIVIVLSLSYGISCGKLGDLYQVYKTLYVGIKCQPHYGRFIFLLCNFILRLCLSSFENEIVSGALEKIIEELQCIS